MRHLEVVALTPSRLLLVVITDTGRVEQRMVTWRTRSATTTFAAVRGMFSGALDGQRLEDASAAVAAVATSVRDELREVVVTIATVLVETLVERGDDRLKGGTSNLARSAADFRPTSAAWTRPGRPRRTGRGPEAAGAHPADRNGDGAEIGEETNTENLRSTSVVSTGYGASGTVFGSVGVVGPTRMDYLGTIASVAAVAKYVGEVLADR